MQTASHYETQPLLQGGGSARRPYPAGLCSQGEEDIADEGLSHVPMTMVECSADKRWRTSPLPQCEGVSCFHVAVL